MILSTPTDTRRSSSLKIALIEPTFQYGPQILAYRKEFLDNGDSMDGTSHLRRYEDPREWILYLEKCKDPRSLSEGQAPATQFILVREEDQKVVGMLQIRHCFTDYLEKYGGHIGYSVAPSERRKGYATAMLHMALEKCRALGLNRILITCLQDNDGSKRTILNNGGVFESTRGRARAVLDRAGIKSLFQR